MNSSHMDNPPLVSIIIVNFNAGERLFSCLSSIEKQTYSNWEVIIIDNASNDHSSSLIESNNKIRIIFNHENVGFAKAQNQGIRLAQGDLLLPLNFDIYLTPEFIDQMVRGMHFDNRIGCVTPKFLYMTEDGILTDRIYAAGHFLPKNRFPLLRGVSELDRGQYDQPEFVFGAPGAAPLFSRICLEEVAYQNQYFDESYFMWYEDVDLDWRIQKSGWKCLYWPMAIAYHIGHPEGYDPEFRAFHAFHSIRNRWAMIITNESSENFRKNLFFLISYELSLIRYVMTKGMIIPYSKAVMQLVYYLPQIFSKRSWVQNRAKQTRS